MRVAMYYNNQDVRVEDVPMPVIGPGELLLKVMASGICGSDVMEWYRLKKAPLVLGHEATGEVFEVGRGVKQFKPGDRVFAAHHVPCNRCHYCLLGHHTACETLHTTNYYPGGFCEYIRVPSANVERGTLLLTKEVSYEEGTFIEPLACVLRAQKTVALDARQTLLILGSGISGLLHLLLARALGVKNMFITDINESRLKMASELGASEVFQAKEDIIGHLRKINNNRLADLVVVCTSSLSAFNQALQAVDRGGTILCFAPLEPGINLPVPVNDFWRNNIKIFHAYGSSPQDNQAALDLLSGGKVPVKKLITHRLKLEQIGLGFQLVNQARDCIKVIIEPYR